MPTTTDPTIADAAGSEPTAGCIAAYESALLVRSIADDTAGSGAISAGGQQLGLVSPSRLQHTLEGAALIAQRPSGQGPTVKPASATTAVRTIEIHRLRIVLPVWVAAETESTLADGLSDDGART